MMKVRMSLLFFSLSLVMPLIAQYDSDVMKNIDPAVKWILKDKSLSSKKRVKLLKCCGFTSEQISCKRGKRGKKGRRGPRGDDGLNACGLGELFLNAPMMTSSGEGLGYPPDNGFVPYSPVNTVIPAWQVRPSTFEDSFVEGIFNVPTDLDKTKPVTAIIHFLVPSFPILSGLAKVRIDMIYLPHNDLIGFTLPATGYDDTQLSSDFMIASAMPAASNNMRHVSIAIELDPTTINGEWALIGVSRVVPAGIEYDSSIYLSTISIRYSRICS